MAYSKQIHPIGLCVGKEQECYSVHGQANQHRYRHVTLDIFAGALFWGNRRKFEPLTPMELTLDQFLRRT
jgi:hypothetical protein